MCKVYGIKVSKADQEYLRKFRASHGILEFGGQRVNMWACMSVVGNR